MFQTLSFFLGSTECFWLAVVLLLRSSLRGTNLRAADSIAIGISAVAANKGNQTLAIVNSSLRRNGCLHS